MVLNGIEKNMNYQQCDYQFGFKRGRSSREAITALTLLIHKGLRKDKSVYIICYDLEKAFNNINGNKMITVPRKL